MAADAYLRVAAGQLQQGATELKREADKARAEAHSARQRIEHDITNLQSSMNATKVDAELHRGESTTYMMLNGRVRQLEQQIADKKRELDQVQSDAEQLARTKESAMQGLQSQANQLQQQAGDPALH